ncbi:Disease resistance protein RGA2 [Dichanthelium oligosanthes]|uniref:Disease resistance protein RGA2 n=1 Tax=Dichanthelium oligosanthes TaxID=888268 RepID=A0A1E5VYR0_9POAL|nr:Disease resistance protein RGA2 [Dichanthelium oligosanthes]
MAEAIIPAFVSDMVSRVISLVLEHFGHQQNTETKLQRICHILIRVHSVVEEAKGRQITNDGTLQWLSELIDGEYQGRHLLDTIRRGEHDLEEEVAPPQAFSLSLFNPLKRVRIATKDVSSHHDGGVDEIDRVLENLQGISCGLKEFIMLLQDCQPIRRPLPTNIFVDGQMFGRHVEKERIINFLLHDNCGQSRGELGVLPIVGDIGSGKTTLVQHACDDVRVRSYFPVIMLCSTYTIAANNGSIIVQSKHVIGDAGIGPNDPLQLFNGGFGNKRFLVVFENMDMRKKKLLEGLLPVLRCSKVGSKVIISTNNRQVATIGTVEPIILKVLPFPEYWFFFKAHAFAGRDLEENPRLVAFGKAIARKLNGSFVGAKMVGGVLMDHPNPKLWCNVLRSNIGGLSLLGDGIGYVADLAENLLPSHVDMCLVTVSMDPFASQRDLVRLQDLFEPHGGSEACLADTLAQHIMIDNHLYQDTTQKPAMADAIISAIIGDVVSRAISLLVGRLSNQESTEDKLQRISQLLIRIHSVVEEGKGRQISNHGTLQWLSELIDSEYQGFHLLDSIRCGGQEAERCDDKVVPQVSTLSLFNPAKRVRVARCTMRRAYSWHHDISVDEIDQVLERLQGMSHDLMEFIMLLQNCQPVRRPLATNIFRDGQMFGRHVEKQRIINFLLHEDDQSTGELDVLPIVGSTGVGKTTLVQHACDDARVRNHFSVILLYSFSCTYDVKKNEGTPNDPLDFVKKNSFSDKRCLMVFGDVNLHRKRIVEEFLQSLRCSEGSKVIITTNSQGVANIGTVEPIILMALPSPEYWFFFKAHAFAGRDIEDNPRLIAAGKEIARKLNGSFFAAKMVGGVLRDHPDPKFWCKVLRSNIGGVYPLGDGIGYISDLADNLLPGHVEMCKVTISKGWFPPETTELATLKDLCSAVPHGSKMACWADDVRFAKVLLCTSVLPFFNHYYIARCSCTCTVESANSCSKLVLPLV